MLFQKLSCVCIPSFRPVAPCIFLAKLPFLAAFERRKECGHIDMLKHSPDDTSFKYIQVCGLFPPV